MNVLNELLEKTAHKDSLAFQTLYETLSPKLLILALTLSNQNQETAEDVLQEAFIKVWNKAHQFNAKKATANTWITRIVRNQALDKIRSERSRPTLVGGFEYESMEYKSDLLPPDLNGQHEEHLAVFEAQIYALPEKQRQCVAQSIVHGYTHTEVSQQFDVPLGTVKAWIRRAKQQFREEIINRETNTHQGMTFPPTRGNLHPTFTDRINFH